MIRVLVTEIMQVAIMFVLSETLASKITLTTCTDLLKIVIFRYRLLDIRLQTGFTPESLLNGFFYIFVGHSIFCKKQPGLL